MLRCIDCLPPTEANVEDFPISIAVRDRVICKKSSVLVPDTSKDADLSTQENIVGPRVQTLMAVPLLVSGSVVGLIYLDSLLGAGQFTADDLKLLTVMANYASLGVERARRAKTEADERLREDERNERFGHHSVFLPTVFSPPGAVWPVELHGTGQHGERSAPLLTLHQDQTRFWLHTGVRANVLTKSLLPPLEVLAMSVFSAGRYHRHEEHQ
jgi:hypothetical protein